MRISDWSSDVCSSDLSEQGYKWITTASWHNDKLSVALTGYLHWFRNFIYLEPAMKYITTMQGSFPTFNYRQTNARFAGLDLSTAFSISRAFEYELKEIGRAHV